MTNAPTTLPVILPIPPRTTTAKAFSRTVQPIHEKTGFHELYRTDATAARNADKVTVSRSILSALMPISSAASLS